MGRPTLNTSQASGLSAKDSRRNRSSSRREARQANWARYTASITAQAAIAAYPRPTTPKCSMKSRLKPNLAARAMTPAVSTTRVWPRPSATLRNTKQSGKNRPAQLSATM